MFFEEDHYVAQDFIHMLHLMEHARQSACPNCKILSLGSYIKTVDFAADSKKVMVCVLFVLTPQTMNAWRNRILCNRNRYH